MQNKGCDLANFHLTLLYITKSHSIYPEHLDFSESLTIGIRFALLEGPKHIEKVLCFPSHSFYNLVYY